MKWITAMLTMSLVLVMFIIYFAPYIIIAGIVIGVAYYIMKHKKQTNNRGEEKEEVQNDI